MRFAEVYIEYLAWARILIWFKIDIASAIFCSHFTQCIYRQHLLVKGYKISCKKRRSTKIYLPDPIAWSFGRQH